MKISFFDDSFVDPDPQCHCLKASPSPPPLCINHNSPAAMGLHMLALASKIKFLSVSHGATPLLASLICPFVVKLTFSVEAVRHAYTELIYAARLFFFQMSQIALDREASLSSSSSNRWERAVRLVYQRVTGRRTTESDEDSFQTLSVMPL